MTHTLNRTVYTGVDGKPTYEGGAKDKRNAPLFIAGAAISDAQYKELKLADLDKKAEADTKTQKSTGAAAQENK